MYVNRWVLGGLTLLAVLGSVSLVVMGLVALYRQPQTWLLQEDSGPPCRVIDSLPFTIRESGSYCLVSDLRTEGDGILIAADHATVDLQGHTIWGSTDPANTFEGIASTDQEHLTIRDGNILGFYIAVRLSLSSITTDSPVEGGWHVVENLHISHATYHGIRTEGNGNVIRNNIIQFIGGNTADENSFGIAIYSLGPGAMIADNYIYEARGSGTDDVGEGVGIAVSDGAGSIITRNRIANSSVEPDVHYAWAAEARPTWAVWISNDDVLVTDNQIINFVYGIAYTSDADGLFANNVVFGAINAFANTPGVVEINNICDLADCYEYHQLPPRDEEAFEELER